MKEEKTSFLMIYDTVKNFDPFFRKLCPKKAKIQKNAEPEIQNGRIWGKILFIF